MIYKRNAAFPYPLLTNDSSAYIDNRFFFDCNLTTDGDSYKLIINYEISSSFLYECIMSDRAGLYLIIDSTDSNFYKLDIVEGNPVLKIPMTSINLFRNSVLQLLIKANEDICFSNNNDLLDFYNDHKNEITVHNGNALGFSNILSLNGELKSPVKLFNKRVDPSIKSIGYDLSDEFITIVYKDAKYQFNDLNDSRNLNNMYIHEGLYRALKRFIDNYLYDGMNVLDISTPENNLDLKIYMLLQAKNIEDLNDDNIDDVIFKISDGLIEKYNSAIRGMIK